MSSGTSPQESAFLDASDSGNDVFFLTSQQIVAQDHDSNFDVYDARVCGTFETSPCLPPAVATSPPCESSESCKPAPSPQPTPTGASGSSTFSGPGNVVETPSSHTTQPPGPPKPKPLTTAQKLAKALKACRKEAKQKRAKCEARARKKYSAKKASKRVKRGRR